MMAGDAPPFHPLAELFPLLDGDNYRALADDIAANGLREPIVLYDGAILDGRNRYAACLTAGVAPEFTTYDGADPLAFVLSLNLHRRHLDESQRGMVAGRIATMPAHRPASTSAPIGALTQNDAAAALNVARRTVQRARVVLDHGTPELIEAVDRGAMAVGHAAHLARAEPEYQRAVVGKVLDGHRPQEAQRQVKAEVVRQREAVSPSGRFRVLYADPPWSYGNTQPDYHPEQRDHYPVMSMAELRAMPVAEWAMDDAVLFLWATSPILPDALALAQSWGFTYKASFVWDKVKHNMGHYNSVRHEFLLVCVRGSCQPDVRRLFDSVVTEERTEHSKKPAIFREIIGSIYTSGPYLELFARERVEGWDAYGNEA